MPSALERLASERDVLDGPEFENTCPSCDGPGQARHPCPYRQDVDDDCSFTCTCCEACTKKCAKEI